MKIIDSTEKTTNFTIFYVLHECESNNEQLPISLTFNVILIIVFITVL